MKSGPSKTQPPQKTMSSAGDVASLVELLKKLRADGHVPVFVTVGACSVQLAPVYGNAAANVSTTRAQTVLEEYGGAAITKLQNELDGDDEDVPAVRS